MESRNALNFGPNRGFCETMERNSTRIVRDDADITVEHCELVRTTLKSLPLPCVSIDDMNMFVWILNFDVDARAVSGWPVMWAGV